MTISKFKIFDETFPSSTDNKVGVILSSPKPVFYQKENKKMKSKFKIGDHVKFYAHCERDIGQLTGTIIKDDGTNIPYFIKLDKPVMTSMSKVDGITREEQQELWAKREDVELIEEENTY